ncbi:MAG: (4Fe-4S)-binding protein [Bacteroidetes bacterium]|nr:(4Fe-4S)-binding protein [Bacteroidota bacterium]
MSNKITKSELAEIKEKNNGSRSYTNGEVTVYWRSHLCIHSANCLIGLPKVFNNSTRPWINTQGASSADIMRVVNTCPSRALTYIKNCGNALSRAEKAASGKSPETKIQILNNGPALIRGNYVITDADGKKIKVENEVAAICRCGSSKKKPFCDGTHHKIGFTD